MKLSSMVICTEPLPAPTAGSRLARQILVTRAARRPPFLGSLDFRHLKGAAGERSFASLILIE
jgi:hypothetical protein